MRLWDRKGVRVGECKAGRFHLLTFLPESSANTTATTHESPKLVRGGRRGDALLPWPPPRPCLRRGAGQDAGLLLGRDWAGALALCYLPSPFRGLDSGWGPPLVGWGERGQQPTRVPLGQGSACGIGHERRMRAVWTGGRLKAEERAACGAGGEQQEVSSSVACPRQLLGWGREG